MATRCARAIATTELLLRRRGGSRVSFFGAQLHSHASTSLPLRTMSTDLPYAADAEVSLSYDELEVCVPPKYLKYLRLTSRTGPQATIREGTNTGPCHRTDEVQLCLGTGEESNARAPGGRRPTAARCVAVSSLPSISLLKPVRPVPRGTYTTQGMPVLPRPWALQDGKL